MDRHALRIWAAWMVFEVWLQVAYRLQFVASYKWFLVGPNFSDSASCVWFLRVLHFGINFCLLYFCCLSIVFSVQTIRYKQFDQALVREILMIGLWTSVQWTIGGLDVWTTKYKDMKHWITLKQICTPWHRIFNKLKSYNGPYYVLTSYKIQLRCSRERASQSLPRL